MSRQIMCQRQKTKKTAVMLLVRKVGKSWLKVAALV